MLKSFIHLGAFVIGFLFLLGLPLNLGFAASLGLEPKAKAPFKNAKLEELIAYALAHNPGWAAKTKALEGAKAEIDGAGGWVPMKLKYSQFIESLETKYGPQQYQISLNQPLPFLTESGLKEDIATFNYQAVSANQDLKKRLLIRNIKATFYDIWQLEQIPKLLEENQKVLTRMATLGSFESQRNSRMLSTIFKAQALIGENAFDLLEMENRLFDAKTKLNNLLGHSGGHLVESVAVPFLPTLDATMEDLIQIVLSDHPKLKEMGAKENAANSAETLHSRKQYMPQFDVGLNYFSIADPTDGSSPELAGKDAYSISLGMTIPFGSSRLKANHTKALLKAQEVNLTHQQKRNDLREAVTKKYNNVINFQKLLKVFDEQLLPPARRSQKLAERLYSSGTKNMMTALEAKMQLINLEIRAIKARTSYLKSLVELEELVGIELGRKRERLIQNLEG